MCIAAVEPTKNNLYPGPWHQLYLDNYIMHKENTNIDLLVKIFRYKYLFKILLNTTG